MNIFSSLFNNNSGLKECPRCVGKGHVDWDDIKRLRRELRWVPGVCAYCNGTGKVDSGIERNVSVDTTYLVANLDEVERKKILKRDPDAIARGKHYEETVDTFINQIVYLHFEGSLTPLQISEFFLIGRGDSDDHEKEQQDMIDYIERVIESRGRN